MEKKILGLDLGTNSIGWALIEEKENQKQIVGLGSRIIPMDATMLMDFEKGKPVSKNAVRRQARSARRLLQRYKLRRSRLLSTLALLGWMPKFESINEMHLFLTSSPTNHGQSLSQFELYELREKALRELLSVEELARIFYQFNQRRGFLSNRKIKDPDEETPNGEKGPEVEAEDTGKGTVKTYEQVEVRAVEVDNSGKKVMYKITLVDKREGSAFTPIPYRSGEKIELLITEKNSKKWGKSYFFQLPKKQEWNYRKHHINRLIEESGLTVGQFYFRELKRNPHFRTKDNIILREKNIAEFDAIWTKQLELRQNLGKLHEIERDETLPLIAENLYRNNQERRNVLLKRGLKYILRDDIIYYQRPLKSQKDSISNCRYEIDKKVIPASHPLYQEFRILDTLNNIRVYNLQEDDCTSHFMNDEIKQRILDKLNSQKSVKPSVIRDFVIPKVQQNEFKLSLEDDRRELRGNDTLVEISNALKGEIEFDYLIGNSDKLERIWHIIYSLDKVSDVVHALTRTKNGFGISEDAAKRIAAITFATNYGAISARAIRRLLPLMRFGNSWSGLNIAKFPEIRQRLEAILNGESDDTISNRIREYIVSSGITSLDDFRSLPYWASAYLVYGSHSINRSSIRWNSPSEVELLPKNFLRNPIVQQVVNETLQVVKDIWIKHGKPNEIRIELARELKNSAKEREIISSNQLANKQLNEAIKRRLLELGRPQTDADKYRIWIESADMSKVGSDADFENYMKYLKPDGKWRPTLADVTKYKLWEEQMHISPYTGRPIPLSSLFGESYQIDHIIPRQRFYDDSLSNKVVVESVINADKGTPGRNLTAFEYVTQGPAKAGIVLLKEDEYVSAVNRVFKGAKRKKLLLKEIPTDFVVRQLKDTQYITMAIREELAKIIGIENVLTTTGAITDHLREQWGIAHLFKELLLPRFEALENKMQEKGGSDKLIEKVFDEKRKKFILKLNGYSKRLDHRHHAADALVIACTKPSHIKRLNDLNKSYQHLKKDSKEAIQNGINVKRKGGSWSFELPWDNFIQDSKRELESCVVSIKNRNRLYTKSVNRYIVIDPISGKKVFKSQSIGDNLNVRGALHNPQAFGEIKVEEKLGIEQVVGLYSKLFNQNDDTQLISKIFKHTWQFEIIKSLFDQNENKQKKVLDFIRKEPPQWKDKQLDEMTIVSSKYTKRVSLTQLTEEKLENVASKPLRDALKAHVSVYGQGDIKKAFTADGVMAFNLDRKIPVAGVKFIDGAGQVVGESLGKQRLVRKNSSNEKLHINTAGNHAFAIYENLEDVKNGVWPNRREFDIVSFYDAILLKQHGEQIFEPKIGFRVFTLSKNDLVYFPSLEENPNTIEWNKKEMLRNRLFNVTKASNNQIYFTPNSAAETIIKNIEFGTQNCIELVQGLSIKQMCIKVKMDRLGNVTPLFDYD